MKFFKFFHEKFHNVDLYGSKFSAKLQFLIEILQTFHEKFHDFELKKGHCIWMQCGASDAGQLFRRRLLQPEAGGAVAVEGEGVAVRALLRAGRQPRSRASRLSPCLAAVRRGAPSSEPPRAGRAQPSTSCRRPQRRDSANRIEPNRECRVFV